MDIYHFLFDFQTLLDKFLELFFRYLYLFLFPMLIFHLFIVFSILQICDYFFKVIVCYHHMCHFLLIIEMLPDYYPHLFSTIP